MIFFLKKSRKNHVISVRILPHDVIEAPVVQSIVCALYENMSES